MWAFKKAFDTIEWDFIDNCLKKFNFGPDIQNWFKVLYNNVNSCVLLSLLDKFKNLSGLEINTKKTEGMWLGCWKNNTETPFGLRWPRDPIKALGIFFSYDLNKTNELNFVEKNQKF